MSDKNEDFLLIENFLKGDISSFNEIVKKYREKIYWHARRMTGNHLDADEIVQEVLMVIYKKLEGFQFRSSLYTWIYRITATRSINFLKKKKLKTLFSFHDQEENKMSYDNDIISDIAARDKLKKIEELLQSLPEKQREIFILRNYEQLTYEEIAEITGKSVGGLKANYFHAINKIMEKMKDYED